MNPIMKKSLPAYTTTICILCISFYYLHIVSSSAATNAEMNNDAKKAEVKSFMMRAVLLDLECNV